MRKGRGHWIESWDTPTVRSLERMRESKKRTLHEERRTKEGVWSRKLVKTAFQEGRSDTNLSSSPQGRASMMKAED